MGTISRTCERRWYVQGHALNWIGAGLAVQNGVSFAKPRIWRSHKTKAVHWAGAVGPLCLKAV